MSEWTGDELEKIGAAEELRIAPRRRDGSLRTPVTIWVVRVGDDLYVRSWRGSAGGWYRGARDSHEGRISAGGVDRDVAFVDADQDVGDAVAAAYREKYRRYSAYVPPMISPEARATTLRLMLRSASS
jgi:hypothetical protein